jgi:hypothetical protein
MSEKTPETPASPASSDDASAVEPVEVVEVVEPVETPEPQGEALILPPEPVSVDAAQQAEPVAVAEPAADEIDYGPVATDETTEVATEPEAAPTPVQTVYVHAPVPPRKRGNRGIGSLIALGSAIIFAAIYAAIVLVIVPLFAPPRAVGFEFLSFFSSAAFFVPVLVFAVVFILLVLILNRANWWAYILGSLFVGVLVYFVSIGILLLVNGVVGLTPSGAARAFRSAAQSPVIVAAGLVAREISLWMGAAVAARGRRVRARNAEDRAAYDRDTARARAEYERAVAANAAR